ncbi:MAG TPA: CoA transferase, partial [Thermoanaerobaculia bacterium]|nr:CoA transferase [Thermoanaerobaculia bacterium]
EAVTEVLELPELKSDPRFQERDERKKNRKALTPLLEAKLAERPTAHWVEALNAKDVPSGAILSLAEALSQPQVEHRRTLTSVRVDDEIGEVKLFNMTAKLSDSPGAITAPPPKLGQHTDEVLGGLGLSAAEIADLRAQGVV